MTISIDTFTKLMLDLEYYKRLSQDREQEIKRLREELNKYKNKVMELRAGYDEEDCTETCPNIQVLNKEIELLKGST